MNVQRQVMKQQSCHGELLGDVPHFSGYSPTHVCKFDAALCRFNFFSWSGKDIIN